MCPHFIYSLSPKGFSLNSEDCTVPSSSSKYWSGHIWTWSWAKGHVQCSYKTFIFLLKCWRKSRAVSLRRTSDKSGGNVPHENTSSWESLMGDSNTVNRFTVATMSAWHCIKCQPLITGSKSSANPSMFIHCGLATRISPGWNRHRLRASET